MHAFVAATPAFAFQRMTESPAGAAKAPEDKATSAVLANINLFMSLSLCLIKLHASPTVLPCASERLRRWDHSDGWSRFDRRQWHLLCLRRDTGCWLHPVLSATNKCPPSSQEQS